MPDESFALRLLRATPGLPSEPVVADAKDRHALAHPRRLDDGRICCGGVHALCDECRMYQRRLKTGVIAPPATPPAVLSTLASYAPPDAYAAALQRLRENT